MKWEVDTGNLYHEIEPVIRGMGYSLVEMARKETKYGLQVKVVIYHYHGVGVNDCETVYRTIMPKIELTEETEEINLEVTSPGITRNIKNAVEFSVFIDREVRVLLDNEEWIEGTIVGADSETLTLRIEDETSEIPIDDIRKAKLTVS
jgi:ribosome maturation factor RimP